MVSSVIVWGTASFCKSKNFGCICIHHPTCNFSFIRNSCRNIFLIDWLHLSLYRCCTQPIKPLGLSFRHFIQSLLPLWFQQTVL
jgi:hypothetical protein